jgi:hypothetical protein
MLVEAAAARPDRLLAARALRGEMATAIAMPKAPPTPGLSEARAVRRGCCQLSDLAIEICMVRCGSSQPRLCAADAFSPRHLRQSLRDLPFSP